MKTLSTFLAGATLALGASQAQVLLNDSFSYPDGALVGAAGSTWVNHSGTAGTLLVTGGKVFIHQNDGTSGREDANAAFQGALTFAPDGNANNNDNFLYSSSSVNFSALPTDKLGSYFSHFKSTTANQFYGRLGANLTNAAAGTFRLAIANGNWSDTTTTQFPQNLSPSTTYTIVTRINVDTGASTLWVNPASESSTSVTATDTFTFQGAIASYALRQGTTGTTPISAPGDLVVDNLRVGRSFSDVVVVPEPGTVALLSLGAFGLLLRRRNAAR